MAEGSVAESRMKLPSVGLARLRDSWWLTVGIWVVAVASMAFRIYRDATRPPVFDDFYPVWLGEHNFLRGLPVYDLHANLQNYLYPPSSLLLLSPVGLVDYGHLRTAILLPEALAMCVAAALALRIVGVRWTARNLGLVVLGITIFEPARALLDVKNIDSVVVLGEVAAVLAMSRNRWHLGAVLLAIAIAIKPATFPLLLLPLLFRQWTAGGLAAAVIGGLNVGGLMLVADGGQFLTSTVPHLVAGNGAFLHSWNISLVGAFSVLGWPTAFAGGLRLIVLAASALIIWRTLGLREARQLEVAEAAGVIVIATILTFAFSFEHYLIYLLPFLPVLLVRPWGFDRGIAWAALALIAVPDVPGQLLHSGALFWIGRLLYTAGALMLLAAYWRRLLPQRLAGRRLQPAPGAAPAAFENLGV